MSNSILEDSIPQSLREAIAIQGDRVYVSKNYQMDSVFKTWLAKTRQQRQNMLVFYEDPQHLAEMLEKNRTSQQQQNMARNLPEDRLNIERARALLVQAALMGASDLHLLIRENHSEVHLRLNGRLIWLNQMTAREGHLVARTLYQGFASTRDATYRPLEFQNAQIYGEDVHPSLTGIRMIRGPAYPVERGGEFVVCRLQYRIASHSNSELEIPNYRYPKGPALQEVELQNLGFPEEQLEVLKAMANLPSGLIAVTGPTGSGKTTLIFEMMKWHAMQYPFLRQVTIEDPIEYPAPWAIQMPITNATSEDATADAFAEHLRTALRMDPDSLLMGEIRGSGSALAALNAALTGHLVFTSLHASDLYLTFDRLELLDPVRLNRAILCDHHLIAGLVTVRLLPKLCPNCKQPFSADHFPMPAKRDLETWTEFDTLYERGPGCSVCGGSGYIHRSAVGEVLTTDSEFMQVVRAQGSDAARKFQRQRAQHTGSILNQAMRVVQAGNASPFDIQLVTPLLPRDSDNA